MWKLNQFHQPKVKTLRLWLIDEMSLQLCQVCMINERHFHAQLLRTGWPTWRMWAAAPCCRGTRLDPHCCSRHPRPSWTHSCYRCFPLRHGWFQGWVKLSMEILTCKRDLKSFMSCRVKRYWYNVLCVSCLKLLYLWPISWAIVIPKSKPVSSVITQLHSLEQAPPSCATPLTCLFPSGNTRSYLFLMEDVNVKQNILLGMTGPNTWSQHTLWCTTRDQHAADPYHWKGWSFCPSHTHFSEMRWCW